MFWVVEDEGVEETLVENIVEPIAVTVEDFETGKLFVNLLAAEAVDWIKTVGNVWFLVLVVWFTKIDKELKDELVVDTFATLAI